MVSFKDSIYFYVTNITDSLSQRNCITELQEVAKSRHWNKDVFAFSPNCPQPASIFLQSKQKLIKNPTKKGTQAQQVDMT